MAATATTAAAASVPSLVRTGSTKTVTLTKSEVVDLIKNIPSTDAATQKKALHALTNALASLESAALFVEANGVRVLVRQMKVSQGNALASVLKAVRAFSTTDFGVEKLVADQDLSSCLFPVFGSAADGAALAVSLIGECCAVLVAIVSRTPNGFQFVHSSSYKSSNNPVYKMLATSLEQRSLDIKLACASLLNTLLRAAKDESQFNLVRQCLTDTHGLLAQISGLEDEENPQAKEEWKEYVTLSRGGFMSTSDVAKFLRSDNSLMRTQLRDVSALVTDYRKKMMTLEGEVKSFRRREPLVRLLWGEVAHLKGALARAVGLGFSYDLGDPDLRYAPIDGVADVKQLDVFSFMEETQKAREAEEKKKKAERRAARIAERKKRGGEVKERKRGAISSDDEDDDDDEPPPPPPERDEESPPSSPDMGPLPSAPMPPSWSLSPSGPPSPMPPSSSSSSSSSVAPAKTTIIVTAPSSEASSAASTPPVSRPSSTPPSPSIAPVQPTVTPPSGLSIAVNNQTGDIAIPLDSSSTSATGGNNGSNDTAAAAAAASASSSTTVASGAVTDLGSPVVPTPPETPLVGGVATPSAAIPDAPVGDIPGAPPMDGIPAAPEFGGIPAPPDMSGGIPSAPGVPSFVAMGPQPSKPVIKPDKAMKALHWKRLIIDSNEAKSSIWSGDEKPKVDEKQLAALFGAKAAKQLGTAFGAAATGGGAGGGNATGGASGNVNTANGNGNSNDGNGNEDRSQQKNIRALNDKRFNALSIILSKKKNDPHVFIEAIRSIDTSLINGELVTMLFKVIPSEEEMASVNAIDCADDQLAKPEMLVRLMSKIPNVAARLECWHFKLHYDEQADEMVEPVLVIERAIAAVMASRQLKRAMATILEIGNYLNGGTARGQADGFELAVLSRLTSIKDVDGTLTILQHCADLLVAQYGKDFGDVLSKELEPIRTAKDYDFKKIINDINKFLTQVKTKKGEVSLVIGSSTDPSDPFKRIMTKFNEEAEQKASLVKAKRNAVRDAFTSVVLYINPTHDKAAAAKVPSNEFFTEIFDFVQSMKSCCETSVKKLAPKKEVGVAGGIKLPMPNMAKGGQPIALAALIPQGGLVRAKKE